MRGFVVAVCGLALAACTPPAAPQHAGPDAVVRAVYAAAATRAARGQTTTADQIPLSESLRADLQSADAVAQRNQEPFLEGDLVLDCQECTELSAVTVSVTTPPANGRAVVEARFTVAGDARVESWDMVEAADGWRADNIRGAGGDDLRKAIHDEINQTPASCSDERGAQAAATLVSQCTQVSPATHPPCNAANSCALIQSEIARGCDTLDAAHKPAFCSAPAEEEAP